jgi:hypothetical protein
VRPSLAAGLGSRGRRLAPSIARTLD